MENKNISITINRSIVNKFAILAIKTNISRKQLIENVLSDYLAKQKGDIDDN